ncbi:MAG: hypothetical protein JSS43_02815 [Proteobacteria bacterium]|nr:hypothetical protein [Pseudomonadota bacterium]
MTMPRIPWRRCLAVAVLAPVVSLSCTVITATNMFAAGQSTDLETYRTFERPDGAYRLVVLRRQLPFAMPGQASDAPGIVRLLDRKGKVLRQTEVEMVQFVNDNTVTWSRRSVHVTLVVDWSLP